ncbi:Zn-dependent hydrolase [Paenibacillus sp. HN-1]|uniref:Zn-dependent hydrolase n=1 Tax=Paenibacillus TaxID=44249 RepID=UPI001CA850A4|nr:MULTISPECIES: Zn-dependent hydrolase [Paenibacillus]MBY9078020.1 Zn-dependent hydrolase [Paenibacillus sp. CGMCC 1.18879]MBY9083761.1 Zn-dependent hydrolase [Paenibacillus sinensis]
MDNGKLRLNGSRLESSIRELGDIGLHAGGGLHRTAFSSADLEGRDWLKAVLHAEGIETRSDEAANIWGSMPGSAPDLPPLVCGSHLDTVPNGGRYDGALGVLLALEVLRTLKDAGYKNRHPFELVSFSAEEPNSFGFSTFGSRVASGKLTSRHIRDVRNDEGRLLSDALKSAGGDPGNLERAAIPPGGLAAYLEVHIEQGKRLLRQGIPLGIVSSITGIHREQIRFTGEANHAGTTLMGDRHDALAAAAEVILAAERICRHAPAPEVVGTVGMIGVAPGAPNIIPGEAMITAEFRAATEAQMEHLLEAWDEALIGVSEARKVKINRTLILSQSPVPMDRGIMIISERQAERLQIPVMTLGSMAGHDAAHMASVTRSGMLFVPSIDGKSHCPEEESRMADILCAGNVLLHTLLALDQSSNGRDEAH